MDQQMLENDIIEFCKDATLEELFEIIKRLNDIELRLEGE